MTMCNFKINDHFLCNISNITKPIYRIPLQYIIQSIQYTGNSSDVYPSVTPTPSVTTQPNKVIYSSTETNDDYYGITLIAFILVMGLLLLNIYKCIKKNQKITVVKRNRRENQIITNPMYNHSKV